MDRVRVKNGRLYDPVREPGVGAKVAAGVILAIAFWPITLVVVAVLYAPVSLLLYGPPKQTAAEKAEYARYDAIRDAKQLVREQLRDPDSAVFSSVYVLGNPPQVVCGVVNAKNGFGGYVGKTPFVDVLHSGTVVLANQSKAAFRYVVKTCGLG